MKCEIKDGKHIPCTEFEDSGCDIELYQSGFPLCPFCSFDLRLVRTGKQPEVKTTVGIVGSGMTPTIRKDLIDRLIKDDSTVYIAGDNQPDSSEEIRENLINLRHKCHYCTTCDSPIKDDSGDCIRTCHYYTKYLNEKRRDDSSEEIGGLTIFKRECKEAEDTQHDSSEPFGIAEYLDGKFSKEHIYSEQDVIYIVNIATAKAKAEIERLNDSRHKIIEKAKRTANKLHKAESRIKELEQTAVNDATMYRETLDKIKRHKCNFRNKEKS